MATKKTDPTPAAAEPMVRIKVRNSAVRFDGQDLPADQVLEVNASAAETLVQQGLADLVRNDPAELSLAQE